MTADNPFDQLLSLRDAAREGGIHQDTLRRQIHLGNLAGVKLGRNWFVTRDEWDRYKREHLRQSSSDSS